MQGILLRSFWNWIHVSVVRPIKRRLPHINCTLLSLRTMLNNDILQIIHILSDSVES